MSAAMPAAKGLMRLPAFVRSVYAAIRDQQPMRHTSGEPSLLYPEIRFSDLYAIGAFFALFYAIRMLLQRDLAHRLFPRHHSRLRHKLAENLFYAIYYTAAFTYFIAVVHHHADWGTATSGDGGIMRSLLSNDADVMHGLLYPFPPPLADHERLYYAQAFGFYLSATVFLLFVDVRRTDFSQFLLHHAVTLGMVALSLLYGYVRAGMVIIALHDVTDIFLYSAKFVHHLGMQGLDTVLFALMAVSFYVARLVMYSRITHAIVVGTISRLADDPPYNRWAMFYDTYLLHYFVFVALLCTLLVLHCFWFALILRLIYREVVLGIKVADTSDAESEADAAEEDRVKSFESDDEADEPQKMTLEKKTSAKAKKDQ